MINILSSFIATFITIPILVYFIIFVVGKRFTKNDRKATHIAIDVSTIFFILSVHYLLVTIFEKSFLGMIFIFILACAIIFVIINWKIKGELVYQSLLKGIWRFNFLFFFLAYVGLTIYGIIQRLTSVL